MEGIDVLNSESNSARPGHDVSIFSWLGKGKTLDWFSGRHMVYQFSRNLADMGGISSCLWIKHMCRASRTISLGGPPGTLMYLSS